MHAEDRSPERPQASEAARAAQDARTLQNQAVRGSFWTVLGTVIAVPLGFFSLAVAARTLGVEEFGHYTLYAFIVLAALAAADLGVESTLVWEATTGRTSDRDRLMRALQTSVTWNLLKVPIVVVGAFMLLDEERAAASALAAGVALYLSSQGLSLAMTAARQYRAMAQAGVITAAGSAAGVAIAAAVTGSAEWTVAAFWIGRVASVPYLLAVVPRELRPLAVRPGAIALDRKAWSFGISSYVNSVLTLWVMGRSELVFVERLGTARAVGQFGLVSTVAQRATLLADALHGTVNIALLALRGADRTQFVPAFVRATRFAALLATASAVVLIPSVSLLAGPVFGPEFGDISIPCAVLLAFALIRTGTQPLFAWIFAERAAAALIVPGVVAALVDVALCLLLIPDHAFAGAVVANGASSLLFILLSAVFAGLPAEARRALYLSVARVAVVLAVSVLFVEVRLPGPLAVELAGALAGTFATTFALTRLLPPLLDDHEVGSVVPAIPRLVRPLFFVSLSLVNGARRATTGSGVA